MYRRAFLGLVGGSGVLGAGYYVFNEEPRNITISSGLDGEQTITLEVRPADADDIVFSDTISLSTSEEETYRGILPEPGRYSISVNVSDKFSESETWDAPDSQNSILSVQIKESGIEFNTIVR